MQKLGILVCHSLTYSVNNNYTCNDGSTPVTGSINMAGNTLYNMSNPVNSQDASTKVYVDTRGGSAII